MISKFLSKLKSILFKSAVSTKAPLKKEKKTTKSSKSSKTKAKTTKSKKNIGTLITLPGVGAKSAKALYDAGFKTKEAVLSAKEKDLLAVSGIGINLVKKLKKLK